MATPAEPAGSRSSAAHPRLRPALGVAAVGVALVAGIAVAGGLLPRGAPAPPLVAAAASSTPPAASPNAGAGSSGEVGGSAVPGPSTTPPVASPPPDAAAALRAKLQITLDRARSKLAIPGASVTILFPDGTSWTGVSGMADVAAKKPVTAGTAFAFASISKTFTSAVILQLVGEGRLHLTDAVAGLVPAGLPIKLNRAITVRMLLDHSSGLSDYFLNPKIDGPLQHDPTRAWTAADALRFVGKPLSPPGRSFHYANTNYLLLGLIAEHVTGTPLDQLIRKRLLAPLGLGSTWYQAAEKPEARLADGYRVTSAKPGAKPADLADGTGVAPFRSVVTAAGGAGSIAGTSRDLARWAQALYGGQVLGADGTKLLLGDFSRTTAYIPGAWYGLGVQSLPIDGHRTFGHSGRLLGFRGAVRNFPNDGLTIAVLTNQSRADPAVIVRALERLILPPVVPPAPSASPTSASPASASPSPSTSP